MKVTVGVLVVLGLARVALAVGNILILVLVSLVVAIGFQPAIDWLRRRGLSRGWAVAFIFFGGVLVVVGFLALVMPIIVRELGDLVRDAPEYYRRAQEESELFQRLNAQFDLVAKLREVGSELPATALSFIGSFTAFVFSTLTVVVLTLYFMSAMPKIERAVAAMLRREDRDDFRSILAESTRRVGGYVLGNIAVSLVAGVVSFTALALIGVPYPAVLAFWVALTDLVPTVGAILGAIAAVTVAAFAGPPKLIATAIFFAVYQQVENYVIQPRVMRKTIDMSAATVILAVLIGGTLAGVVGALLAIPTAAIIKVAWTELFLESRLAEIDAEEV